MSTWKYKMTMHNSQCTYLNSSLLVAPLEYVLHGLVLGIDWTLFWPLLMSMHLVATPNPVSNCLWWRFKFHPNVFCYLGGFSLMYIKHTTTLYNTGHTRTYITLALLFTLLFVHLFHFSRQAGCPPFPLSATVTLYKKNCIVRLVDVVWMDS